MQQDIQIDGHQKGLSNNISSSTSSPATRIMEKPGQEQLQLQQQALKCPRCDSSNTKFCYYNNYSLSQPRHFCKACKRYWTRGGTLRNVPVGGGCRKNKRVKRPGSSSSAMDGGGTSSSTSSSAPVSTANNNSNPPSQPSQIDQINPMFYGVPSNPFMDAASGFDLQSHHQLNHHAQLGLGFSSTGTIISSDSYRNRFNPTTNSSLPANYSSMFSTSPSTTTTTPTMASVLASKFINGGNFKEYQARGPPHHNQYFQNLLPFADLHIAAGNSVDGGNGTAKEVKVEDQGGQKGLEWNINNNNCSNVNGTMNCQNQITEQMGLSDPTLYWSSTTLGTNWHDPANLGSSVSSLI